MPLFLVLLLLLAFGQRAASGRALKQQQPASWAGPDSVQGFRQAGCANASELMTWQPFRPGYHVTAPYGWINDPHGLFERQGLHHLFFQYNPKAIAWGAPFWGHIVSSDLAHWQWLPPALLPDTALDFNGIWSGAATIAEDGTPWLSYTAAATKVPELGNFFQSQAVATPADPKDPYLKEWRKSPLNPVLRQTPPGGTNFQFRDTTPANRDVRDAITTSLAQLSGRIANTTTTANAATSGAAPRLAWAVGTQAFCLGTAALYTAPAMEGPWTFSGTLFNQMAVDKKLNGQCEAAGNGTGAAYGGPCNQFGSKCRMWEVVDFAQVAPGMYAVKWSDQDRTRRQFSTEWYVLSDELNAAALKLGPEFNDIRSGESSAFDTLITGRLGGKQFKPLQLNYGSTYASKFEHLPDGRLIMNTWVQDTFIGCIDACSDHTAEGDEYVKRAQFKGVLQLPRQVTYSPETRSLVLFPIADINALRNEQIVNINKSTGLPPASGPLVLMAEAPVPAPAAGAPPVARQFHAHLEFVVAWSSSSIARRGGDGGNGSFTMGARLLTGHGSYADVLLRGTVGPGTAATQQQLPQHQQPQAVISSLHISVDKARVGGFTSPQTEGGPVPLPVTSDPPAAGGGRSAAPPTGPQQSTVTPWRLPDRALTLDLFVDHSIIEVYAMGGLGRVTSKIYPEDDSVAWGLAVWGSAPALGPVEMRSAQVWHMDNAWAQQPPLC